MSSLFATSRRVHQYLFYWTGFDSWRLHNLLDASLANLQDSTKRVIKAKSFVRHVAFVFTASNLDVSKPR